MQMRSDGLSIEPLAAPIGNANLLTGNDPLAGLHKRACMSKSGDNTGIRLHDDLIATGRVRVDIGDQSVLRGEHWRTLRIIQIKSIVRRWATIGASKLT